MKRKLLPLLTMLLCFWGIQQANAQITSVSITTSKLDSFSHSCVPSSLDVYYAGGSVVGTFTSSDSLTFKFYFGDGTSETFKKPIDASKTFNIWRPVYHSYSTAGTYTTKIVVTAPSGKADSVSSSPFTLSTSCAITSVLIDTTITALDSFIGTCSAKSLENFILSGSITGTVGMLDSLSVKFDYGDGTFGYFKMPMYGKVFYAGFWPYHVYATPGTYTTKVVITAPSGKADSMTFAPFTIAPVGISSTKLSGYGSFTDSGSYFCKSPVNIYFRAWGSVVACLSVADTAIININFDDGSDTTVKAVIDPISLSYSSAWYIPHVYTMTGTFNPRITVVTKTGAAKDTLYLGAFTISTACATLSGKLYIDANSNCAIDLGEDGIQHIPIKAENTSTGVTTYGYAWSDASGNYSYSLPPATYKITPMVKASGYYSASNINPTCPSSGTTTLTVAASTTYTRDFAYECTPIDTLDASTSASSTCFIKGDTAVIYVRSYAYSYAYYAKCVNLPTTLSLTLDPDLSYAGALSGTAPASIVGKVITWNLTGGDIFGFYRSIKVAIATTASIGDTLRSTLVLANPTGLVDSDLTNNTYVHQRVVASSFDPNIKEAAPSGKTAKGYIPTNSPMTYTIHFQNTGTAPARNITVVDTFENNLDESSFFMMNSTHNAAVYLDGKVVKFRFTDIYLPDSTSDYYGSMGAVTFGIRLKKDLPAGTEIKNRAAIYFDYNEPIITNYTLNTIEFPTSIQEISVGGLNAKVFPNPAHSILNVTMGSINVFSVTMTDMLGRRILESNSENGTMQLDIQNMMAGIYLLNIKDNDGNQSTAKVVITH